AQQTKLPTTRLGETGLEITRLGFGAWAIGGTGYEFAWGGQDDDESLAAIERALDLGVNWIDTRLGSGLLTGAMTRDRIAHLPDDDWRRRGDQFTEPRLSRNLALVERLWAVAGRHHTTPGAVAVAWTLRN